MKNQAVLVLAALFLLANLVTDSHGFSGPISQGGEKKRVGETGLHRSLVVLINTTDLSSTTEY